VRVAQVGGIPAAKYPTRARRPVNSRMSTAALTARFGLTLPPWERGVELLLDGLAAAATRPS
jgi:dTDP-4-dehydrorhamnose reductase